MLDFETQKKILEPLLKNSDNHKCADCDTISPTWASLDFGVFLCSNCSGAHRALGPTVTRVRSANLDLWKREWVENMLIGNYELNEYWEGNKESAVSRKPKMGAELGDINRYVYLKYIKRSFVKDLSLKHPLAAFKNGEYQLKKDNKKTEVAKPAVTEPVIVAPKTPVPVRVVPVVPVVSVNPKQDLLDINFGSPSLSLKQGQEQKAGSYNEDDEFTDFADAGTSVTYESKDAFISFDHMMTQNKQQNIPHHPLPPALHHSFSAVDNGIRPNGYHQHHPYNPSLGQNNLVYNSHFQQPHQPQYQGQYMAMHGQGFMPGYVPQVHVGQAHSPFYGGNFGQMGQINQYWG